MVETFVVYAEYFDRTATTKDDFITKDECRLTFLYEKDECVSVRIRYEEEGRFFEYRGKPQNNVCHMSLFEVDEDGTALTKYEKCTVCLCAVPGFKRGAKKLFGDVYHIYPTDVSSETSGLWYFFCSKASM